MLSPYTSGQRRRLTAKNLSRMLDYTPNFVVLYQYIYMVSKVDYCCSVLAGISGTLLQRLQSVMNAAARLVFSARRSEHTTPLLRELHWLQVPERIQFRLCVLVYRCLMVLHHLILPRPSASPPLFCQELKTALFSLSFDIQDWLRRQFFFFLIVKCPCNSYTDNVTNQYIL